MKKLSKNNRPFNFEKIDHFFHQFVSTQDVKSPLYFSVLINNRVAIKKTNKVEVFNQYQHMVETNNSKVSIRIYKANLNVFTEYTFMIKFLNSPYKKVSNLSLNFDFLKREKAFHKELLDTIKYEMYLKYEQAEYLRNYDFFESYFGIQIQKKLYNNLTY